MSTLNSKIKVYLQNNSKKYEDELHNYDLQDDGEGSYIKNWAVDGLEKPTDSQLNALNTEADTLEKNETALGNRKAEYGSWEDQLDYIYHNGITNWKSNYIKPIKDKYPKEE